MKVLAEFYYPDYNVYTNVVIEEEEIPDLFSLKWANEIWITPLSSTTSERTSIEYDGKNF